jgi:hypothetical protein
VVVLELQKFSTSVYCFSLGIGMISWFSKKQAAIALSSVEVENLASLSTSCEVIWIHKLVAKLTNEMLEPTLIVKV